jgi:predicted secreted protein
MLRTALVAIALAPFPLAALAGDQADREIIGFSLDGGVFAFEEYGVEDGSGFPYSNIFLVETDTDEWVEGTPVRLRVDDDSLGLGEVRAQAREQAQPILDERQVEAGHNLLASNPLTEVSANPHEVRFVTHPHLAASDSGWTVSIAEKELPAPNCPDDVGGPYKGFSLVLTSPDGETRTLHDDDRIPASRGCAMGYSIADVISAYPDGGEPVLVILVNTFPLGFEGPNRRFLAVTTRFAG